MGESRHDTGETRAGKADTDGRGVEKGSIFT